MLGDMFLFLFFVLNLLVPDQAQEEAFTGLTHIGLGSLLHNFDKMLHAMLFSFVSNALQIFINLIFAILQISNAKLCPDGLWSIKMGNECQMGEGGCQDCW